MIDISFDVFCKQHQETLDEAGFVEFCESTHKVSACLARQVFIDIVGNASEGMTRDDFKAALELLVSKDKSKATAAKPVRSVHALPETKKPKESSNLTSNGSPWDSQLKNRCWSSESMTPSDVIEETFNVFKQHQQEALDEDGFVDFCQATQKVPILIAKQVFTDTIQNEDVGMTFNEFKSALGLLVAMSKPKTNFSKTARPSRTFVNESKKKSSVESGRGMHSLRMASKNSSWSTSSSASTTSTRSISSYCSTTASGQYSCASLTSASSESSKTQKERQELRHRRKDICTQDINDHKITYE
jgi:hypothetical protein